MFRDRSLLPSILLPLLLQARTSWAVDNSELPFLRFTDSGTFQIAVFSDMHFAQSTDGKADRRTVGVMEDVLDYDAPDLVVLNGDLTSGDMAYAKNSTLYIDQVVAPMVDRNLTWASTYGNHDSSANINGTAILEREQMWPGARTQEMTDNSTEAGTTNYYLQVYRSDCTDASKCTPELLLWFFDSRGGQYPDGSPRENWVDESVVTWFNETNTDLVDKYNKTIPSLAFVHIPINATAALEQQLGVGEETQPGINDEGVFQQGEGWCSNGTRAPDECSYGGQDVPFMRAIATTAGIMGLFYGHDHGNTWCYRWDTKLAGMDVEGAGIHLCYGQHTGYGGYGDWIRGGRQIVVTEEKLKDWVVDTHIRLESGDVVGAVTLNSTFNEDTYSVTPDQKTYLTSDSTTPAPSGCLKQLQYLSRSSALASGLAVVVLLWF